jgi:hypothetical protein
VTEEYSEVTVLRVTDAPEQAFYEKGDVFFREGAHPQGGTFEALSADVPVEVRAKTEFVYTFTESMTASEIRRKAERRYLTEEA